MVKKYTYSREKLFAYLKDNPRTSFEIARMLNIPIHIARQFIRVEIDTGNIKRYTYKQDVLGTNKTVYLLKTKEVKPNSSHK